MLERLDSSNIIIEFFNLVDFGEIPRHESDTATCKILLNNHRDVYIPRPDKHSDHRT